MTKALKTAAIIVGAAALIIGTAGVLAPAATAGALGALGLTGAAATGAGLATVLGATAGLLSVGAALTAPKLQQTLSGTQEKFTASKDQGVPIAFGRTGVAGFLVHRQTFDYAGSTNNAYQTFYGVWSGAGPIDSIESFAADGTIVSFSGTAATGARAGYMWLATQLGATPESGALQAVPGAGYPAGWSAASKLSGYAAFAWTVKFDDKGNQYPGAVVPQPLAILKGVKAWDPRHDSTYPGGSGAQRQNDPTTWAWTQNPWILALQWALGWWQNGKRVLGIGLALAAIDVPAFVGAANVSDANGWTAGGVAYSTDGKWDVLKKLAAAGSGEPLQLGGTLSCTYDTPRVSLATITTDQIIGDCTITGTPAIKDRINGVIPTYRSEAHSWSLVPGALVQVGAYVSADGRPRTRAVTYELCQSVAQVAELAAYTIVNSREFGPIVTPLKLRWAGYKPGDALTIASDEIGLSSQLVVVRKRHFDPASGAVTLTSRSETYAKHAFALGQTTTAPPTPALQSINRSALLYAGAGIIVQGSVDGSTAWHTPPTAGDFFIRVSTDNGNSFGAALPVTSGISPYLTNDPASVAADSGGVVSSFSGTGGTYVLLQGANPLSGVTFTVVSGSATGGLSIAINSSTGVYSVSGLTADQGTAILRATYGGVSYDQIYSLTKQKQGATGAAGASAPLLTLSSTSQVMTFDGTGAASPSSQTISISAIPQNITGTASFAATAYSSSNTSLGAITLGGSGNTRTLTNSLFATYANTAYVIVTATLSGQSDTETFVRLQSGSSAVTGILTNESASVQSDSAGTVASFATAGGTFQLYLGANLITSGVSFAIVGTPTGVTGSINSSTGVYSITAMSADQATITFRATYGAATFDKVYNIAKSKAGAAGNPGIGTTALAELGPVTFDGVTLDCATNGGLVWNNQGAWSVAPIAGGAVLTWKAPYTYTGGATDFFIGLRSAPSGTFSYSSFDLGGFRFADYNTGIASGVHYECWTPSGAIATGTWNPAYSYQVRYDYKSGISYFQQIDTSGNVTTLTTFTPGSGKSAGVQATFGGKGRVINLNFGSSGSDGTGGSFAGVHIVSFGNTTSMPPVSVVPGQTVTFASNVVVNGSTANIKLQLSGSVDGGASYSTIGAADLEAASGDPSVPASVTGSYTNSTGSAVVLNVLAALTLVSGSGTVSSAQSTIRQKT